MRDIPDLTPHTYIPGASGGRALPTADVHRFQVRGHLHYLGFAKRKAGKNAKISVEMTRGGEMTLQLLLYPLIGSSARGQQIEDMYSFSGRTFCNIFVKC